MKNTVRRPKITASADGKGIVPQAGALLLAETLRVTGLGQGLAAGMARWRSPRAVHDPVPPEYSIGRLTCRYWQPAWRCDGWLFGCL